MGQLLLRWRSPRQRRCRYDRCGVRVYQRRYWHSFVYVDANVSITLMRVPPQAPPYFDPSVGNGSDIIDYDNIFRNTKEIKDEANTANIELLMIQLLKLSGWGAELAAPAAAS